MRIGKNQEEQKSFIQFCNFHHRISPAYCLSTRQDAAAQRSWLLGGELFITSGNDYARAARGLPFWVMIISRLLFIKIKFSNGI